MAEYFQPSTSRRHYKGKYKTERKRENDRPPPHLKGKEIGLFYAKRSRQNLAKRPLATILLSDDTKDDIQSILNLEKIRNLKASSCDTSSSYEHVRDSSFKRDFLRIIQGNITDKLKNYKGKIEADPRLDKILYEQHVGREIKNLQYKRLLESRSKLPSYQKREELLKLIDENQVVVVSGETGCGKTTQVAQFILDDFIEKKKGSCCRIICTQPRRISAISVAERVAAERGEKLGLSIGYCIRMERKFAREKASINFCTTGVVLKNMENDPTLSNISHLILDEIHERDVLSDFLLTIVKRIIAIRKDLKLILMSATLNSEKFSRYYNNAPHINIPGFTYNVEEFYLEDVLQRTKFQFRDTGNFRGRKQKNKCDNFTEFIGPHLRLLEAERKYDPIVLKQLWNPESEEVNLDLILELLKDICKESSIPGAILIFLPGYADISKLNSIIENSGKFPRHKYTIYPLHSKMPTIDQREIFEPAPPGKQKIIISTNIAETSITIDDVVYVIDCGKIKMFNFDPDNNIQTLLPQWVSLANARQRKGRAGRVRPGVCFHLYTKAREMVLDQYQKPEILRKRLEDVILTMKLLQLGKVEEFFEQLLDSPDAPAVSISLQLLKQLNALDDQENLTPLGYHLAKLPIGAHMGKMILLGAIFSCLDPVLSVAASLDFKDAFRMPLGKERQAEDKKVELNNGLMSDHLLLHQALHFFEHSNEPNRFCREFFLSWQTLKELQNLKKEFMHYLYDMNFVSNLDPKAEEWNINSSNWSLVKAVIASGLYPNVAIIFQKKKRAVISTMDGETLKLHPKSVLSKVNYFSSPLMVYYLKLKSSAVFLHDATTVYPLSIVFFGDSYKHFMDNGHSCISINDRLKFKCSQSTAMIIRDLRNHLNWYLEYKISHPGVVDWRRDEEDVQLLSAIMELITVEDIGDLEPEAYDDYD